MGRKTVCNSVDSTVNGQPLLEFLDALPGGLEMPLLRDEKIDQPIGIRAAIRIFALVADRS